MEIYYEIAGSQIDGARELQEDAFLTTFVDVDKMPAQSVALVLVTDGMGGHAAGNIASNMVVSTFNKHFTSNAGKKEPPELLRDCLRLGNQALQDSIRETPALHGMGCTMVGGALVRGKLFWVSVGDSHLYHLRDGKMEQRNEDHSYGGYLDRLRAEGLDPKPEQGLSRHMLMSAVTGDEIAEIDCPDQGAQLLPEDRLILATDGIDTLGPERIASIAVGAGSARDCVQMLLDAVEKDNKPRQDNTTVVVVDVREREPKPEQKRASKATMMLERPPGTANGQRSADRIDSTPGANRSTSVAATARQPAARKSSGGLVAAGVVALAAAAGAGWYWFQVQAADPSLPVSNGNSSSTPVSPVRVTTSPEPVLTTPNNLPSGAREPFTDVLSVGGQGPTMVPIPPAMYRMGGDSAANSADEQPARVVELRAFAVSRAEITVAEYRKFASATGRRIPASHGLDQEVEPVSDVSWRDATAYASWLTLQSGEFYRLPTEAEWEFVAGVGTRTAFWWGGNVGQDNARCFDCGAMVNPLRPAPVMRFAANPLGVHDTAGNVAEWVEDCYVFSYVGAPRDGSAVVSDGCVERVIRGGGYRTPSPDLRATRRDKRPADARDVAIGFRVARDAR